MEISSKIAKVVRQIGSMHKFFAGTVLSLDAISHKKVFHNPKIFGKMEIGRRQKGSESCPKKDFL